MAESPGKVKKVYFEVWERTGVTEHMGGIEATKSLARMSKVAPGQLVLDIGCGTGYTAAYLAGHCGTSVVCMDITPRVIAKARDRISREGLSSRVSFIRADAHRLPFRDAAFDRAIAESVLVFCDKDKVSKEVYRVLKAGGIFGDNELTFVKPPLPELLEILSPAGGLDMAPLAENEWDSIYEKAGFRPIEARISKINFLTQLIDHIRIDGAINYFKSAIRGASDPILKKEFFNKYTLLRARSFSSYVGFGLYASEKRDKPQ